MFKRIRDKIRVICSQWAYIKHLAHEVREAFANSFNQTQFLVGTAFGIAGYTLGHILGWWWL